MAWDAKQLLAMSQQQLDTLFSEHDAGPIPDGEAKGTAIIAPGTAYSDKIADLVNIFGWQGKVFDAEAGTTALLARYNSRLYGLGRQVRLRRENAVFDTVVTGVTPEGRLQTKDTLDRSFSFGEVEWIM